MGVEVFDRRQYLFDVELCNVPRKATGMVDFIPEVPRVYRLMGKDHRQVIRTRVGWRWKRAHTVTR